MERELYDVIVIGAGPAGLTAGALLAGAKYRVLIVEKESYGGQLALADETAGIPGAEGMSGQVLTEALFIKARSAGAEFLHARVTGVELSEELRTVSTDKGDFSCFGVLLAVGAPPLELGFTGEVDFRGRGIGYHVLTEGLRYTGKEVFAVGGDYEAVEASLFLTRYASHVTLLTRWDDFSCEKALADEARANPDISVLTNTTVERVEGTERLEKIVYRHNKSGKIMEYAPEGDIFGVFLFPGCEPQTDFVRDLVTLTDKGYIVTDSRQRTGTEGIYAAGDACAGRFRQAVTAIGDAAAAAAELERYCTRLRKKTGLKPDRPESAVLPEETEPLPEETPQPEAENAPAENPAEEAPEEESKASVFDEAVRAQLGTIFERMEKPLQLKLALDERPVSAELEAYLDGMAEMTEKLEVVKFRGIGDELPYVKICREDGTETGLCFHGMPGGYAFTPFVLALYNAAGPGQPLPEALKERALRAEEETQILAAFRFGEAGCQEAVSALARLALLNGKVRADIYDWKDFDILKEQYRIPEEAVMIVDDGAPHPPAGSLEELLDFLKIT